MRSVFLAILTISIAISLAINYVWKGEWGKISHSPSHDVLADAPYNLQRSPQRSRGQVCQSLKRILNGLLTQFFVYP